MWQQFADTCIDGDYSATGCSKLYCTCGILIKSSASRYTAAPEYSVTGVVTSPDSHSTEHRWNGALKFYFQQFAGVIKKIIELHKNYINYCSNVLSNCVQ